MSSFNDFIREELILRDDYEGPVKAVLLSKKCKTESDRAVLYIHGFSDYFFNRELADNFIEVGFDFYAIDLRKYGRSLMDHQHPNMCKDLKEYYEELNIAIDIIKNRDKHDTLIINAHSTGGLLASLFCHDNRDKKLIDGLILNSPWFDINESWFNRKILLSVLSILSIAFPCLKSPVGLDPLIADALHKDCLIDKKKDFGCYEEGYWDFNLDWKKNLPVYIGFLRAVRNGQKRLYKGLDINCPIYLLCSDKKGKRSKELKPYYFVSDCALNPKHMINNLINLGKNTKLSVIKDGVHDLALSGKKVRNDYFDKINSWLINTYKDK